MPLPAPQPLSEEDSKNLFFKAAEFLNRTNSATMGAVTETLAGGDPLSAAVQSLKGEKVYGGQDLMAQLLGGSPDDKFNRRAGLVADILNPLDPLNYVGVGGLTKAGKAAKVLGVAADTIGAQTKLGERGLLTFMGTRVPLPGDAALMGLLGKGGSKLAESGPGKGVRMLFGGAKGYVGATEGEKGLELLGIKRNADAVTASKQAKYAEVINRVSQNLPKEDTDAFLQFADGTGRAPGAVMDDAARFIGSGPNAARRKRAVDAYLEFQAMHAAETKALGDAIGQPILQEARADQRFLSRLVKHGGPEAKFYDGRKTGEVGVLEGASNNRWNWSLVPRQVMPIERASLTDAGKAEFDRLGGEEFFTKLREEHPKKYIEFNDKYRMNMLDQDAALLTAGERGLVKDLPVIMRTMGEDTLKGANTAMLLDELIKKGYTKAWDEVPSAERHNFVKIDQGKYAGKPIAMPLVYENALKRIEQLASPTADKPLVGEFLSTVLPSKFQDLGLMSWLKGMMIYGGGPLPYLTRNMATGVHKNMIEGMGMPDIARLYPKAAEVLAQHVKGDTAKTALSALGVPGLKVAPINMSGDFAQGVFTSKYGTKWDMKYLMGEYMNRGLHGGGDPMQEIVKGVDNASTRARQRVMGGFHKAQFESEIVNRLSLMMHTLEEVEGVYRKAGKQIPQMVNGNGIGDFADVAMTNAKEAVIRAHFDYNDLTPFEKRIRDRWIPFYTWMRKNIPNESVNMIQNFGRYMPYVRAYSNAFEQQQITPEDLPEWAANSFAMPIAPDDNERARWLDWTGWLPMMDVAEAASVAGQAVGAVPTQAGKTPQSEMLRYIAIRMNPLITMPIEQMLQKDIFSGRSFSGDTPADVLGQTVGAPTKNVMELFRPITELDRLNPGNVFGPTPRPHRNEPGQAERFMRSLTGIKVRATDQDEASMSFKDRSRYVAQLRRDEQRELKAGNVAGAKFIHDKREKLERGLR